MRSQSVPYFSRHDLAAPAARVAVRARTNPEEEYGVSGRVVEIAAVEGCDVITMGEIDRIAAVYREFKRTGRPKDVPGICGVATKDVVEQNRYALTPGRYVGSGELDEESEPFEEKMGRLSKTLNEIFVESVKLEKVILKNLKGFGYGE
jgi:type I restriction enzyme M protein